jgi:DNA-binding NarL/FixJ family response regulator
VFAEGARSVIRIVLAEDHAIVREGIASLLRLETDLELVAEVADGAAAVEVCERLAPDVLLLDMRMPKLDGIGVVRTLAAAGRLPPTLVLTTFDDDPAARAVIAAGARGFLLKDISRVRLVAAVRTLAAGGSMISPAVTEAVQRAIARSDAPGDPGSGHADAITERERAVLRLIAAGYSNREVATTLSIAEGTVKNHVSNILTKLDARDRTHAVLRAVERGYI